MRIEFLKDSEPHFKGSVVDVDMEVGDRLIETGIAKEVDPRKVELKNVAALESQNGVSILDQRKKKEAPAKDSNEDEDEDSDEEGDKYDEMGADALKAELKKRELPVSGKVDELRDRLREDDEKAA